MQLIKLHLSHYRNLKEVEIFPSRGTNLFVGSNAQGKTNLLEAIYFLGYGKSFRTNKPSDCIRYGCGECRIQGTISRGALTRELQVCITPSEKKLYLHGKLVALDEFAVNLHLLAFTHEHLNVVRGGPAERRAFLDRAMVSLYPGHISRLAAYQRALKQRNKILFIGRDGKKIPEERLLHVWNEALIKNGSRILWNRLHYVKKIKEELPRGLFGSEELKLHYLSSIAVEDEDMAMSEIESRFQQRLLQAQCCDQKSGFTSVGPHRDELKLYINGKSLVDFGSAGQQRSCLLSLYFSQMEIHRKTHGFYPVFLVDDVEAELDEKRLKTFLGYLSPRAQTFLTSARKLLLPYDFGEIRCFDVRDGCVSGGDMQ